MAARKNYTAVTCPQEWYRGPVHALALKRDAEGDWD